jgi:ATP-dependent helicase HrpA
VLNQVNEDRAEWLVPGMLKDKVAGPCSRACRKDPARALFAPESATRLASQLSQPQSWANGSLTDALLKVVRARPAWT